jgi:hypothetical protein
MNPITIAAGLVAGCMRRILPELPPRAAQHASKDWLRRTVTPLSADYDKSRRSTMKTTTLIVLVLLAAVSLTLSSAARAQGPQQADKVELVGQIGGGAYAVAVRGDYAYMGVGPRLAILNVANPAQPAVIGQTGVLPGIVYGVAVSRTTAYVATGRSGLRIINLSDPAQPTETGFNDTPGYAFGVAVSASHQRLRPSAPHRDWLLRHRGCPRRGGERDHRLRRRLERRLTHH